MRAAKRSHTVVWMTGASLVAALIAGLTLTVFGTGSKGTLLGLQLTARWSYCLFVPAYVGGALATVYGPSFQPLARRGRDFGLSFASAHLMHFGLVLWLYHISPRPPLGTGSAIFFGVALALTYLLALLSIPTLAGRLPPPIWWALRAFGMDFIALAFLRDFLRDPLNRSPAHLTAYLPFVALGLLAAALRAMAYAKRLRHKWLAPQGAG